MKKLVFGLGCLGVLGAFMATVTASSYSYHLAQYPYFKQYYPEIKPYRPSTLRMRGRNPLTENQVVCKRGDKCFEVAIAEKSQVQKMRNYRRPVNYRRALDEHKRRQTAGNPRYRNTYQTQRLYVRNNDYREVTNASALVRNSQIFETAIDNIKLTLGSFSQDASGVYRSNDTSLAFRVVQTGDNYQCSVSNFFNCAQNLNKAAREKQKAQGLIRNLETTARYQQIMAGSFDYYPTTQERFDTINGSKHYVHFSFSTVNPENGKIVRIEGVALDRDKANAAARMYRLIQSFRFAN